MTYVHSLKKQPVTCTSQERLVHVSIIPSINTNENINHPTQSIDKKII